MPVLSSEQAEVSARSSVVRDGPDQGTWNVRTIVLACRLSLRTEVPMHGKRDRPAETGKLTERAARISPAAAIAGTMLGVPDHVRLASPARAYVVQADDTLWSIAQRFYGNPLMWSRIYYANLSQTHNSNVIYHGREFTIPQAGAMGASVSATSANPAQASSPSSETGYIHQTAQGASLPGSAAAAQVQTESSYQAGAIFSAGAEGPFQFMPSRWAGLGSAAGEEFNWTTSTNAYINYMRQLLAWSDGNMRQALARYNAGQANWQPGLGYADQILSMAGQGRRRHPILVRVTADAGRVLRRAAEQLGG
jgi:LysM repeat protein